MYVLCSPISNTDFRSLGRQIPLLDEFEIRNALLRWISYAPTNDIHRLGALFPKWLPGHQIINCNSQQFICFQCHAAQFWLDEAQKSCSMIGCSLKMKKICIAMKCFNIHQHFLLSRIDTLKLIELQPSYTVLHVCIHPNVKLGAFTCGFVLDF